MQSGYFVPIFLLSLMLSAMACADESLPWERRTPFREGTIYYEMSGTQQGTEVLYIKEYGRLRVKQSQSTMEILGRTVSTSTREVTTPEWIIRYNLSDGWGEKNTNPARLYQQEYEQLSTGEKKIFAANASTIGPSLFENAGSIVQSRSATMLGFSCDQVSFGGFSSSCLLHNTDIPLKSEARVMGVMHQLTAVRIDLASPVPEEVFLAPAGIQAGVNEEVEAMLRKAIHQAVQILKQPDGVDTLQKQARQFLPRQDEEAEEQPPAEQKIPPGLLRRTVR